MTAWAQEIDRLKDAMSGTPLDLKVDGQWNVAPGREKVADRLLRSGLSNASTEDLDYALFKSMTTMGGAGTFKAILPWFLQAVMLDPNWGHTVGPELLVRKLDDAAFGHWNLEQRVATIAALKSYWKMMVDLDADDPELDALKAWLSGKALEDAD